MKEKKKKTRIIRRTTFTQYPAPTEYYYYYIIRNCQLRILFECTRRVFNILSKRNIPPELCVCCTIFLPLFSFSRGSFFRGDVGRFFSLAETTRRGHLALYRGREHGQSPGSRHRRQTMEEIYANYAGDCRWVFFFLSFFRYDGVNYFDKTFNSFYFVIEIKYPYKRIAPC